jgi:hypothetical protein
VQRAGVLKRSITTEHYHDVGKLMFAFTVFWTYIAFSQYMLQWYANLPEETHWYYARQQETWLWISLALLFCGFVIPFLGMLSRVPKRRLAALGFWAVWLLLVRWLDQCYLALPPYQPKVDAGLAAAFDPNTLILAPLLLVAVGGIVVGYVLRRMAGVTLAPERDPRLPESLAFENV